MTEDQARVHELIQKALALEYRRGLMVGLGDGLRRLEALAAVVPTAWSKTHFIEVARLDAVSLRARLERVKDGKE